jgi:hypothetical protein
MISLNCSKRGSSSEMSSSSSEGAGEGAGIEVGLESGLGCVCVGSSDSRSVSVWAGASFCY